MSTAVSTRPALDLILVRLLASGNSSLGLSRLRSDLERFFPYAPSLEDWERYREELVGAGLVETRALRLTEAGRRRALEFLGLDQLPPRTNWKTLRARYLLPRALGIEQASAETRKRLGNEEGLGAWLLRNHYSLPAGSGATLTRTTEALVCKQLGYPEETSLAGVQAVVLGKLLGTTERLKLKDLRKQLPRRVAGARRTGIEGLREAVLRRWIEQRTNGDMNSPAAVPDTQPEREHDLSAFAATVRAVARNCPTGRFGDKVFISHVWRALHKEPGFQALELDEFRRRLLEANRAGLLRLQRADLVQAMDPGDVRQSETPYLNAVFHFVLLEKDPS